MKHVWVVDDDIDVTNSQAVEWAMATRFQADRCLTHQKSQRHTISHTDNLANLSADLRCV